MDSLGMLFTLF